MSSSCSIAPRWVWNCLPGCRTTVCSRPLGSVSCTRSPTANAPGTASPCVVTGGQPTDAGGCALCPPVRRGPSELSVGGPSLGCMTAMAQDSTSPGSPTDGPTDAPVDPTAAPRRPSLSPSRAADFKTCPLLYRFRTLDRLPERKSRAAVRGTLVHAVLEKLYELPAAERTPAAAQQLLTPAWAELRAEPGIAELFEEAPEEAEGARSAERGGLEAWLASAGELVETYFRLEDPPRILPEGREELVEVPLPDGLLLRGYVDRLDVAPTGA